MVVFTVELAVASMKSRRTLFFGVAYDSRNGTRVPVCLDAGLHPSRVRSDCHKTAI
jgi:hypothetical protein